jgi:3-methyladenine DNA glycosylase AlkD
MSLDIEAACEFASGALAQLSDPEKAREMQRYMKTDMPFYGVQKPGRTRVMRRLTRDFPPGDRDEYERLVLGLWHLPHREEKYLALGVATSHRRFIVPRSLSLYRRLIREGAWWDLVDEVATHLVRELARDHPDEAWPEIDTWIHDEDMWLRRAAIICQVGLKQKTDADRLFRFCRERSFEKEFFIRKAIGWSLREYAKTDPGAVAHFVRRHRDDLSGLSFREATKHIRDRLN